jgi:hypothetical protein
LRSNPNLDVDTQAKIAPALAAIHNVIRDYDSADLQALLNEYDNDGPGVQVGGHSEGTGNLAQGPARSVERRQADDRRDRIAGEMWQQYQAELQRRNII